MKQFISPTNRQPLDAYYGPNIEIKKSNKTHTVFDIVNLNRQ